MSTVKYKEEIERSYYACDLCGERILQDGKNIVLVRSPENTSAEYNAHFHATCLLKRLPLKA